MMLAHHLFNFEMMIGGLIFSNTFSLFFNVYIVFILEDKRMIQLKTVLTIIQIILCVVIIVLGFKIKSKINMLIGVCMMIISIT